MFYSICLLLKNLVYIGYCHFVIFSEIPDNVNGAYFASEFLTAESEQPAKNW